MKKATITVAVIALMLAPMAPAWAHVTANPNTGPAEGRVTTFFRVGHGCDTDGPHTEQVSIQIPDGVISVGPEEEPGWTVETRMRELDEPIEGEGDEEITEVVSEVIWTADGAPLDTHHFREFGLSLNIAAPGEEVLYFPTVQRCQQGSLRWVNIPPSVEEWGATEDPAPFLQLTAAEEDDAEEEETATTEGMDPEEIAALAADQAAAEVEDEVDPLVYVALALGALGLLFGLFGLLRGRRA